MKTISDQTGNTKIRADEKFRAAAQPSSRHDGNKRKSISPITLRLTEEELEKLNYLSDGMSRSAYIRKNIFGKHASPRKVRSRVPVKNSPALAQVLGLLGQTRIANNLNQLAHEANCGSFLLDDQTETKLLEACANIAWIRVKLIEALGLKKEVRHDS